MQTTLLADWAVTDPVTIAIPGARYVAEAIEPSLAGALVAAIDGQPWTGVWQRRTQHYGSAYLAGQAGSPMPDWLRSLGALSVQRGWLPQRPEQAGINEYLPGQGIARHIDRPDGGPIIVIISLLSPVVMDFAPLASQPTQHALLEPRSAVILQGEARHCWLHGIAKRRSDRWQGVRIPRARRLSISLRLGRVDQLKAHDERGVV